MMTVYSPAMTDFDKVTIITGGSKGIGQGIARVFVRAGALVVIGARGAEEGRALAVDEGRYGVRVNTILPGVIGTPMHWNYVSTHPQPERFQGYVDSWQWLGRIGTLEEVGHACLFLASEGAAFITGAELIISGGAELAYGVKLAGAGLLNV